VHDFSRTWYRRSAHPDVFKRSQKLRTRFIFISTGCISTYFQFETEFLHVFYPILNNYATQTSTPALHISQANIEREKLAVLKGSHGREDSKFNARTIT
jgi:hypothetical protein